MYIIFQVVRELISRPPPEDTKQKTILDTVVVQDPLTGTHFEAKNPPNQYGCKLEKKLPHYFAPPQTLDR